jgi:CRP-like cAMP-binding protein
VRVADADPQLLDGMPPELLEAARHRLVARTVVASTGRWDPLASDLPCDFGGWLGLLVLDGLVLRQIDLDGLPCCEVLGPGDVLRPWDDEDGAATLQTRASWRILQPARLALLDAGFARRAARWPSVGAELMRRSLARTRSLTVLLAATQARRADVRLRALFLHLADRWGRMTPDGVLLELALTHKVISQLTGLRRPSVSISLAELERNGEIVRLAKDAWIIRARATGQRR